jgi:FlaA1/EpsC-like NDP-sugar epimerase
MIKFLNKINDRFVSKWLVLAMDIFIVAFSFVFATTIRYNFDFTYLDPSLFKYHLLWVMLLNASTFLYFKTYQGIIRHTSVEDAKLLFKATFFSSLGLCLFSFFPVLGFRKFIYVPFSIIFIDFFIVLVALVSSRFLIKAVFEGLSITLKSKREVMIFGAGRLGLLAKNTLIADKKNNYQVLFFIDDNTQKSGKSIEGIKVISKRKAQDIVRNYKSKDLEVIFAVQSISSVRKTELVEEFMELGAKIKIIPPVKQWINGTLSVNQIQQVRIEDLLDRPTIQINNRLVKTFLYGKRVMITGAAGSIGSEIVRQVLSFEPAELVLVDQAETPLYDIETELTRLRSKSNLQTKISFEIRNITNAMQMEKVFVKYRPEVFFHAAAYKHVPLMEANPFKAIEVNTLGTQLMADLASKYKVDKFVFISTDKAVNPTNVMGASKRLAEMYVQGLNKSHQNDTRFIVTRFGNVLGSNGSVIPLFKKQIEKGGPVTVTHKDIIRYFMTIPEACQLVLEAGTMGKGGEIYVFDMGFPVRIVELAERMIKLSGFEPYSEIAIEFSGLRPGEKLYEELLGSEETTIATHHPKIMVAKVNAGEYEELKNSFDAVRYRANEMQPIELVKFLKSMVPDYISNNSTYQSLDNIPK